MVAMESVTGGLCCDAAAGCPQVSNVSKELSDPMQVLSQAVARSDAETDVDLASPMQAAAVDAANLLRAIGSPHRLLILCLLMEGERTVSELCDALGLRQSLVSQHLTHLRLNGLVVAERRGHFAYYALINDPAREIVSSLYRHFCAVPAPVDRTRG